MSLLLAFAPTVFPRVTPDYLASRGFSLARLHFSVFEVVRLAYLSRSWFVLRSQSTTRQASHASDFVRTLKALRNLYSQGNFWLSSLWKLSYANSNSVRNGRQTTTCDNQYLFNMQFAFDLEFSVFYSWLNTQFLFLASLFQLERMPKKENDDLWRDLQKMLRWPAVQLILIL